jgi:hypothetical protein
MYEDNEDSEALRPKLVHMTRNELLALKADLEFSIAEIKLQIRTASDNPEFKGSVSETKNWMHRTRKALIHKRYEANQIVVELSKRKEEKKIANSSPSNRIRISDNPQIYEAFVEEASRVLDPDVFAQIQDNVRKIVG